MIKNLDEELQLKIQNNTKEQQINIISFVRAGSSLHPEQFNNNSDIDYFLILDKLTIDFVNNFEGRKSPALDKNRLPNTLINFYWRISLQEYKNHPVTIHIYTKELFQRYCDERSGTKMYLLHEHIYIIGKPIDYLESLKLKYPPTIDTAKSDLKALLNPKYQHRFLWAWRSVALIKNVIWLRNKGEISQWVVENYGINSLNDKQKLILELNSLILSYK